MFSPVVLISLEYEVALMKPNLRLLYGVLGKNSDTVMELSDNLNPNKFTWLFGVSVVAKNALFDIVIVCDVMCNDG